MSNLTGLGLTCFAAAVLLAFAVPVNWTFAVTLPCVFLGLAFLVWDEVHAHRPKRPKRHGKFN